MSAPGVARSALAMALCGALVACGGSFDADEPATMQTQPARATAQPTTAAAAPAVPAVLPTAARPLPSTTDDLVSRIARLEAEVASLKSARVAGAPAAPAQASPVAPTENPEAAETSFRREETDPAWSRNAALQVRQAIGQVDPLLFQRLQTVECRTRNCRLEFAPGDDANSVEASLPSVITELESAFAFARTQPVDHGTGRVGTVLFLSR